MNQVTFHEGTGRRKTAVARVRLLTGEGEVVVNGRSLEEHFGNAVDLTDILMPFRVTGTEGQFNAMIKVQRRWPPRPGRRHPPRHRPGHPGVRPGCPRAAAPGRPALARSAHEGAQEVRPQASPQGAAVHQALARSASRVAPR